MAASPLLFVTWALVAIADEYTDLHEGNILFRLPNFLDGLTPSQLYEKFGEPELEPVQRLDGQPLDGSTPSHGVVPVWLGDASENVAVSESQILLTDFSESFCPARTQRYENHTPLILRPPESLFATSMPVSFPTDTWALACTIFAILGQRPLFESWFPTTNKILEEHTSVLGVPPHRVRVHWKGQTDVLNNVLRHEDGRPPDSWRIASSTQSGALGVSWVWRLSMKGKRPPY